METLVTAELPVMLLDLMGTLPVLKFLLEDVVVSN